MDNNKINELLENADRHISYIQYDPDRENIEEALSSLSELVKILLVEVWKLNEQKPKEVR